MKIHHIGYLVTNLESACADFQKLGYHISLPRLFDEERKIFIMFLDYDTQAVGGGG